MIRQVRAPRNGGLAHTLLAMTKMRSGVCAGHVGDVHPKHSDDPEGAAMTKSAPSRRDIHPDVAFPSEAGVMVDTLASQGASASVALSLATLRGAARAAAAPAIAASEAAELKT